MTDCTIPEGLVSLLEELDGSPLHINDFFRLLREHLAPFARSCGLACLEFAFLSAEDSSLIHQSTLPFEARFSPDAAPSERALVLDFHAPSLQPSRLVLTPCRGIEWDARQIRQMTTVGRICSLLLTHISLQQALEPLRLQDMLTGLPNTQGLLHFGKIVAERNLLSQYSGIFISLKSFRFINEQFGSEAGDLLLQAFGSLLLGRINSRLEMAARLGGDNFFLLVDSEQADAFSAFLRTSIPLQITLQRRPLTISVECRMGICRGESVSSISQMITDAAIALDSARKADLSLMFYSEQLLDRAIHIKRIASQLPNALANHEIVCFYQPKVNIDTLELVGCEALARWIQDGKIVPPDVFIPAVEESSLIADLDFYTLKQACQDIHEWVQRGISPVRTSINCSKMNLRDPLLAEHMLAIIHEWQVDPRYIEIEITESTGYANEKALSEFIRKMHAHGISISMDDFGTGLSSLSLFKSLSFDVVKLDRSFVEHLTGPDSKESIILENIIRMLSDLDVEIISEGVETPEQIAYLRKTACRIIQGYYFDPALPREIFTSRLRNPHYTENTAMP